MRHALENFQAVANDVTSAKFWERHRDFHWALLAPAANPTIERVLDHLWQSSERYVRLFVSTFATMQTMMHLHIELYDACAGGDVATFENAIRRHYIETEKTVREGFRSFQAADLTTEQIGRRGSRKAMDNLARLRAKKSGQQ